MSRLDKTYESTCKKIYNIAWKITETMDYQNSQSFIFFTCCSSILALIYTHIYCYVDVLAAVSVLCVSGGTDGFPVDRLVVVSSEYISTD